MAATGSSVAEERLERSGQSGGLGEDPSKDNEGIEMAPPESGQVVVFVEETSERRVP